MRDPTSRDRCQPDPGAAADSQLASDEFSNFHEYVISAAELVALGRIERSNFAVPMTNGQPQLSILQEAVDRALHTVQMPRKCRVSTFYIDYANQPAVVQKYTSNIARFCREGKK